MGYELSIFGHICGRVPGEPDALLLNPFGLAFDEITASSLVKVDASGAFANVTSYKYGDGLVLGKHKVSIDYATDAKGKFLVPKDYTHGGTTPLIVEITESSADAPLEIKVPRP